MPLELSLVQEKYGLTSEQVKLAFKYVETGILSNAAESAGMSVSEATKLLFENSEWRKCVTDLLNVMLVDDMVKARAVARTMMDTAKLDKTRLEAVKLLWDRAAGEPLKRIAREEVTDMDKLAAAIVRLAGELGMNGAKLPIEGTAIVVDENGRVPKKIQRARIAKPVGDVRHESVGESAVVVQPGQEAGPDKEAT